MPDQIFVLEWGRDNEYCNNSYIEKSLQRVDPIKWMHGSDLRDVRIALVYIDRMLHNKIEYIRKQLLKNVHRVFIMEQSPRSKILFLSFFLATR